MKTKAIARLCKKDGFIRIINDGSGTWIGDDAAELLREVGRV